MIYLMRHGQDDESFIGGWSDVSLIPEGILEVKESAIWIKENLNIKNVQCSDVTRAVQTTKIVSDILGITYSLNSNLREQNKGDFNGKLRAELTDDELIITKTKDVNLVYPNGESLMDLYNRMKKYISKLLEMEDDTLLITHRGVINMIYYILYDIPLDMNKKQFGVVTASVHELDKNEKTIKKVR